MKKLTQKQLDRMVALQNEAKQRFVDNQDFITDEHLSEEKAEEWKRLYDVFIMEDHIDGRPRLGDVTTKIYSIDARYDGINPNFLRFEVHNAGDHGIYNEIAVCCINEKGENVGEVYVGLCQDKKDMRLLITTDGEGDGDQSIAVYPMRPHDEAVDVNWQ